MMKYLWAIPAVLLFTVHPARAGQIQFGEKWYNFQDIIPEGGPSITTRGDGFVRTSSKPDPLIKQPAKMLMLMESFGIPNRLLERFWPIKEPGLTLHRYDRFGPLQLISTELQLQAPIKRPEALYQLQYELQGQNDAETMEMFSTLIKTAQDERFDPTNLACIEMTGDMTWWSFGKAKEDPSKPLYTYSFMVRKLRVVGHLKYDINAPEYPGSLQDAMAACTPQP